MAESATAEQTIIVGSGATVLHHSSQLLKGTRLLNGAPADEPLVELVIEDIFDPNDKYGNAATYRAELNGRSGVLHSHIDMQFHHGIQARIAFKYPHLAKPGDTVPDVEVSIETEPI